MAFWIVLGLKKTRKSGVLCTIELVQLSQQQRIRALANASGWKSDRRIQDWDVRDFV